jgi:membrane protein DedA with SNARE-associated domain
MEALPDAVVYLILTISAYIENIFPPIPGDTITAFGAFLVGAGRLNLWGVFGTTTIGSLLGFITLFRVGRYLGRRFFLEKDYRFLRAADIIRAETWFQRFGYFLVALNRFFPGIRSAIAVVGGISRLRSGWVAWLALLSCSVWNLIWISLGFALGSQWETVEEKLSSIFARYNVAVCILLGIVGGVFVFRKIRRNRSRPPVQGKPEPDTDISGNPR